MTRGLSCRGAESSPLTPPRLAIASATLHMSANSALRRRARAKLLFGTDGAWRAHAQDGWTAIAAAAGERQVRLSDQAEAQAGLLHDSAGAPAVLHAGADRVALCPVNRASIVPPPCTSFPSSRAAPATLRALRISVLFRASPTPAQKHALMLQIGVFRNRCTTSPFALHL